MLGAPSAAQVHFEDAAAEAGIDFVHHASKTPRKYLPETMSGGVAIFDYDRDGWMDIFFVNGAKLDYPHPQGREPDKSSPNFWNRLFRNKRDGTFEDVTERVGLQGRGYGMGAAVGDIDSDGFPDLIVTQAATGEVPAVTLYRNEAGRAFADVTQQAGINARGWATSAAFLDYDLDGALDLFVCRYMNWRFDADHGCGLETPAGRTYCHPDLFEPVANLLYRNQGDGTFLDVSEKTGVASHLGKGLGVAVADFDGDRNPDLAVANDSHPQFLFRNQGDGTFTEEGALAGVAYDADGREFAGMGIAGEDLTGDGLPDLLITTLSQQRYAFFKNLGDGLFEYATDSSGLSLVTRLLAGWGVSAADFDHDGHLDVFFANGHVLDNIERSQPHVRYLQPPSLLSLVEGKFRDLSATAGQIFAIPRAGRGLASGDLDNDGDVDVVVSSLDQPPVLGRNQSNTNRWIGFELRGARSNTDAIGARVTITLSDRSERSAVVSRAGSYLSSRDSRLFFGLGLLDRVSEVRVTWPNGIVQKLGSLPGGRVHVLLEPQP